MDPVDADVPPVQLSGYFDAGGYLLDVFAGPDERIGRDRLGGVRVEGPVTDVAVRLDGGAELRRRLSFRVVQVPQVARWIQAHGNVGGQHVEAVVVGRNPWVDKHIHREAIRGGFQLLEAQLHDGRIAPALAQVQWRKRGLCFLQLVDAEQRQDVHGDDGHQNDHADHDARSAALLRRRRGDVGGDSSAGGGGASEVVVGGASAVVGASALIGRRRPGRKAPRGEMLANPPADRAAKSSLSSRELAFRHPLAT